MFSANPTVSVQPAVLEAGSIDWSKRPAGGLAGVAELSGVRTSNISSVAMVDAEAIAAGMPAEPVTWYDTVIAPSDTGGWFGRMDTEIDGPLGSLLTELPMANNGQNIVLLIARPERLFPLLETRDADGQLTGIHIDLLVIGELSKSLRAWDGRSEYAAEEFAAQEEPAKNEHTSGARGGLFTRIGKLFKR